MDFIGHNDTILVVGLGNPSDKYKLNRHNVGFMCVDAFAFSRNFKNGIVRTTHGPIQIKWNIIKGKAVILLKPQDYMNSSGIASGAVARAIDIQNKNILAIYDDLDFDFGEFKLKSSGGSGGHNGVKSLIEAFGKDFNRFRIGIGRPEDEQPPLEYVLSNFTLYERQHFCSLFSLVISIVDSFVEHGAQRTMNTFNAESINVRAAGQRQQ